MAIAATAARNVRMVASRMMSAPAGSQSLPSSGAARQTGAKPEPSYNDYQTAEHMYNLPAMKHKRLKFGLGVFGSLAVGIIVPIFAVTYANKKTGVGHA